MKRILKLAVIIVISTCVAFSVQFIYLELTTTRLDIFYTNDLHGNVLPRIAFWHKDQLPVGGIAALASYLKRVGKHTHPFLLLDAGDFYQGTPEGDLTKGEVVVKLMNHLNYDAAVVGNHEYDFGEENFRRLTKLAKFAFLGANIYNKKSGKVVNYVQPYIIKEIKGIKIGIFGLTTSRMKEVVLKGMIENIEILREIDVTSRMISELKAKKVNLIIAITHIGFESEK